MGAPCAAAATCALRRRGGAIGPLAGVEDRSGRGASRATERRRLRHLVLLPAVRRPDHPRLQLRFFGYHLRDRRVRPSACRDPCPTLALSKRLRSTSRARSIGARMARRWKPCGTFACPPDPESSCASSARPAADRRRRCGSSSASTAFLKDRCGRAAIGVASAWFSKSRGSCRGERSNRTSAWRRPARARALDGLLADFGLQEWRTLYPGELSLG